MSDYGDTYNDRFVPSGLPICDPDMPDSIEGDSAVFATHGVRLTDNGPITRYTDIGAEGESSGAGGSGGGGGGGGTDGGSA